MAVAIHPRATFTTEIMRRHITELRSFELGIAPHPSVNGVNTLRLVAGSETGGVMAATTGIKWNVTDTVVLSGQILWTLSDRGLTAPATPTVAAGWPKFVWFDVMPLPTGVGLAHVPFDVETGSSSR